MAEDGMFGAGTDSGGGEDPAIKEAQNHGWVDKEHFKGDPNKWVDAKTFMERADTFIPFLKKQKQDTEALLAQERLERQRLAEALEASRRTLEILRKDSEEVKTERVEGLRKELKGQLAEAMKNQDFTTAADITEKLAGLREPEDEDEEAPNEPGRNGSPQPQLSPEFVAWARENPWYGTDPVKSGVAKGVADKLRMEGDTSTGRAFLDKVSKGVNDVLGPQRRRDSKVEEGRHSGGRPEGGTASFHELPEEAKRECMKEATRRVGPNKRYKTDAEWQNFFATQYFNAGGTRQ